MRAAARRFAATRWRHRFGRGRVLRRVARIVAYVDPCVVGRALHAPDARRFEADIVLADAATGGIALRMVTSSTASESTRSSLTQARDALRSPKLVSALVHRYAESEIPTEYGTVRLVVYREGEAEPEVLDAGGKPTLRRPRLDEEHMALIAGDLDALRLGGPVLARVHSECWTGEVLRSHKCDCREQLDVALRAIAEAGRGVVVYLRQEGRGIGLGNKVRAYALQEQGADTVDANRLLGFADDARTYDVAAAILRDLGIPEIALLTNNPAKVDALREHGIGVVERVPLIAEPNEHNADYLAVKARRMGHDL